jgi:hypothetical protein
MTSADKQQNQPGQRSMRYYRVSRKKIRRQKAFNKAKAVHAIAHVLSEQAEWDNRAAEYEAIDWIRVVMNRKWHWDNYAKNEGVGSKEWRIESLQRLKHWLTGEEP